MPDAALLWGSDLAASATGDIATADGPTLGQQRVLRRLLTNLYDYTWNPHYGGGLGQFVGQASQEREIEGAVRAQLFAEAAVGHVPDPSVETNAEQTGDVFVQIRYADQPSAATQILTFSLGI